MSTGAATDHIYVPSWPHFESMKFLDDSTPNRSSLCTYATQELHAPAVDIVDLTQRPALHESSTATSNSNINSSMPDDVSTPSPKPVKQNQSHHRPTKTNQSFQKSKNVAKDQQGEIVDECLEVLRSVREVGNPTSKDRCDCYGQYVAACLKEMTQWNQSVAIAEITNVLLKYDPNNPQ